MFYCTYCFKFRLRFSLLFIFKVYRKFPLQRFSKLIFIKKNNYITVYIFKTKTLYLRKKIFLMNLYVQNLPASARKKEKKKEPINVSVLRFCASSLIKTYIIDSKILGMSKNSLIFCKLVTLLINNIYLVFEFARINF